jgi:hypothetical protein
MDCDSARLQLGADPRGVSPELAQHVAACRDCKAFELEMRSLDERIHAAMSAEPALPAARARAPHRRWTPSARAGWTPLRWALAASAVLAVGAAMAVWSLRVEPALANELVAHMAEETDSWSRTRPVPRPLLEDVLRRSGVRLAEASAGDVVYAHSCFLRGRYVPHLVVRGASGPVTVIVLRGERIDEAQKFAEGGYSGVIAPLPGGAVAILARGTTDIADALTRVAPVLQFDAGAAH